MSVDLDSPAADLACDLADFVAAAPTSYHAAAAVRARLAAAGYAILDETAHWDLVPGGKYVVVRDGAVIGFALPEGNAETDWAAVTEGRDHGARPHSVGGTPAPPASVAAARAAGAAEAAGAAGVPAFHVFGAHTDSPALKLKTSPDFWADGAHQVGVEIYGGPLQNSWLDRELCLAGRLTLREGTSVLTKTGPIARVPQLAIHLDRAVNDGLKLDPQRHMQPVIGLDVPGAAGLPGAAAEPGTAGANGVLDLLAAAATDADGNPSPVSAEDIVGHDVYTIAAQAPTLFGANEEFLASPRLDNLSSVYAGTVAMEHLDTARLTRIPVFAAFDHEEVGSETRSGAAGPFLSDVLERISAAVFAQRAAAASAAPAGANPATAAREFYLRQIAASTCVSSDAGHAAHPNYPERHDPVNRPRLGAGPLLKINAKQRYATDSVGTAVWAAACADAGVDYQPFVSNNAMPCGSTIGPITAGRLGMTTVDVGIALWSMHSAREMCAVADVRALVLAAHALLR